MDYTICLRRETGHCCLLCDKKKGKSMKLKKILFFRLHATRYPDGWDMNGVGCTTDCNTANTCKVCLTIFRAF